MKEDVPSATALLIALSTVWIDRDRTYAPLLPHGAAEACARFVGDSSPWGRRLLRALEWDGFRSALRWLERLTLPGIQLHYALRKRFLEEAVRSSLGQGFEQLVVLGGGFDTLALRLHSEYPGTQFLEVDHPATQRVKRRVLGAGVPPGRNLRFVEADFTRSTPEEFLGGCPAGSNAVFVMEGVLMYLSAAETDRVFRTVLGETAPALLERTTLYGIGAASMLMLGGSFFATLRPGAVPGCFALALLKFLAYGTWMLTHDEFRYAVYDYGTGVGVLLGLHACVRSPASGWLIGGILTSLVAAALQLAGVSIHEHFNHNDLYHVVQMGGNVLLYRGARLLRDRRTD